MPRSTDYRHTAHERPVARFIDAHCRSRECMAMPSWPDHAQEPGRFERYTV